MENLISEVQNVDLTVSDKDRGLSALCDGVREIYEKNGYSSCPKSYEEVLEYLAGLKEGESPNYGENNYNGDCILLTNPKVESGNLEGILEPGKWHFRTASKEYFEKVMGNRLPYREKVQKCIESSPNKFGNGLIQLIREGDMLYLVGQGRGKGGEGSGRIDPYISAGGLDRNETIEDCIKRETREELGIPENFVVPSSYKLLINELPNAVMTLAHINSCEELNLETIKNYFHKDYLQKIESHVKPEAESLNLIPIYSFKENKLLNPFRKNRSGNLYAVEGHKVYVDENGNLREEKIHREQINPTSGNLPIKYLQNKENLERVMDYSNINS